MNNFNLIGDTQKGGNQRKTCKSGNTDCNGEVVQPKKRKPKNLIGSIELDVVVFFVWCRCWIEGSNVAGK